MSAKKPPQLDDIDDFLRHDSRTEASTTDLPKLIIGEPIAHERATDKLVRLNHCATHINQSLRTALDSANDWRAQLDEDLACDDEFTREMTHWDAVMSDLEAATTWLPSEDDTQSGATDDANEADVATAIANEFDAELQAEADRDDIFSDLLGASEAIDELIEDDELTVNRDQQELLLTLVAQETRIRELEARLQKLGRGAKPEAEPLVNRATAAPDEPYVNRLIVAVNGNENLKYPLAQSIMTIGREPQNDIQIRSRYISRFHARIVSDGLSSTIEDLDSRNGVAVNSEKVRRKQLRSGDLIDLGRMQFKFIDLMEGTSSEGRA